MIRKAHEKLKELEQILLTVYRERVQKITLVYLEDYLLSKDYCELTRLRDQMDECMANIDEIRMVLWEPPFGAVVEDDED